MCTVYSRHWYCGDMDTALTALGYTVSRPETDALFGEFDPDGSGQIEFNELYKLLRRGIKRCAWPICAAHTQRARGPPHTHA